MIVGHKSPYVVHVVKILGLKENCRMKYGLGILCTHLKALMAVEASKFAHGILETLTYVSNIIIVIL